MSRTTPRSSSQTGWTSRTQEICRRTDTAFIGVKKPAEIQLERFIM